MLTTKQQYVINLIAQTERQTFTTEDLYLAQDKNKLLSRKAIVSHLLVLMKLNEVHRVKRGNYALKSTAEMPQSISIPHVESPTQTKKTSSYDELPSFLAHEDIEKLLDWKSRSINEAHKEIAHLQLKVTKLEKQKETISNIKIKFC